jgi:hypothetical protein
MKRSRSKKPQSPSELIDARIAALDDWRGEMLSRLRALITEADPGGLRSILVNSVLEGMGVSETPSRATGRSRVSEAE